MDPSKRVADSKLLVFKIKIYSVDLENTFLQEQEKTFQKKMWTCK